MNKSIHLYSKNNFAIDCDIDIDDIDIDMVRIFYYWPLSFSIRKYFKL